jgi:hypothetical protein
VGAHARFALVRNGFPPDHFPGEGRGPVAKVGVFEVLCVPLPALDWAPAFAGEARVGGRGC